MKLVARMRTWITIAAMMLWSVTAFASGTCSITSVSLAAQTYTTPTAISASGTVNWTCTRTASNTDGTPTTLNVTANAGMPGQYANSTRNAVNGSNTIAYALSTASASVWGDGTTVAGSAANVVTASFPSPSSTSVSGSFPFTFSIAASLTPYAGLTYTDTVSIGGTCTTKKGTACAVTGSTLSVSVYVQGNCSISLPPADLSFNYDSFQKTQAQANSQFSVKCDNGTPYHMTLSPTNGTLLALPYNLTLGTAPNDPTDISSATANNETANGANQAYYVNGTIAPGLAGDCATASCLATSSPHTLTLTY